MNYLRSLIFGLFTTIGVAGDESHLELREAAQQGNSVAQYVLGLMYFDGHGVAQDYKEAAQWFRSVVEREHPGGKPVLANFPNFREKATATEWYLKAAEKGVAGAQLELGLILLSKSNRFYKQEAVKWIRKAASQGYAKAQTHLGELYLTGISAIKETGGNRSREDLVTQDVAEAEKWYLKAALQGYAKAQVALGRIYLFPHGNIEDEEDEIKLIDGLKWIREGAEQGHPWGQHTLAQVFFEGKVVPEDSTEGMKWLRKAAEQRYPAAQCELGLELISGERVSKNEESGLEYIRKAALQTYPEGLKHYGICLQKGIGVSKDLVKAYFWVTLASNVDFQSFRARSELRAKLTDEQINQVEKDASKWRYASIVTGQVIPLPGDYF